MKNKQAKKEKTYLITKTQLERLAGVHLLLAREIIMGDDGTLDQAITTAVEEAKVQEQKRCSKEIFCKLREGLAEADNGFFKKTISLANVSKALSLIEELFNNQKNEKQTSYKTA